ncbi:MAG: DUF2095 domain-containing protein [Thermoprotei archaeon]|nr:MAG: DUF2095 domain-containing protein [Thermoprotei archaeon]
MEMDVDEFKRKYPHLAKEILNKEPQLKVKIQDPLRGFQPSVVDFIRRANTVEEAEEVINYLEQRGEITHEEANEIRKQLHEKGLESFGSRKRPGYYFRYAAGLED